MLRFFLKFFIIIIFFQLPVFSKNYNNILIEGNERISFETIIIFANIPPNKSLNDNLLNSILKNIYNSGFFKDVIVKIENDDLTFEPVFNINPIDASANYSLSLKYRLK